MIIGAYLNALGILAGAMYGLAARQPVSARGQNFFKAALGLFTMLYGVRLVYENIHGSFTAGLKQLFLGLLAVVLGNWVGRLLRVQKFSNRIGHQASVLLAAAQKHPPGKPADGVVAATLLFCAAPLGILGAVADGLSGYFYLLLLKGVMDGLAMVIFVKLFRWPVALSAIPVFLFLNGFTLAIQLVARPWLDAQGLAASINVAIGLVTCIVTVVIFEVRKVELNSYLPAIIIAPILKFWLG
jgi:uncharacterized membrane protein YqgA involved in biofilm formation